jgi:hypothetical protein
MSPRPDNRERAQARTRAQEPAPPSQAPPAGGSQVDLKTLVLTAIASAVAAFVVSHVWAPGTLFSAAMTPVIVALVREGLRRPADRIATVAPSLPRRRMPGDLPDRLEEGTAPPVFAPAPGEEAGPVRVYSTPRRRRNARVAVLTGLAGFLICVIAYTVPDLVAGRSILGGHRSTTLFDSHRRSSHPRTTTTTRTQTTTAPATTVTTTVPARTTTVTAPQQTTPAPSTTPAPAAPQQTTPAPAAPPATAPAAPQGAAPQGAAPAP